MSASLDLIQDSHDASSRLLTHTTCGDVVVYYPPQYEISEMMSTTSSGAYFAATNKITETQVTIKRCHRGNIQLAKRTHREIKLLRNLQHPHILPMLDLYLSPTGFAHIISERLDTTIKSALTFSPFEEMHARHILYQILLALEYVHCGDVIHRDLKPANIHITRGLIVKISEFGLARIEDTTMTGYVVTRHYRAPEIMLSWQGYTKSIDIWSAGCIFAEMLTQKTLFPGDNNISHFRTILQTRGMPSEDVINNIQFENTRSFVRSLPNSAPIPLEQLVPASPLGISLLDRMLDMNPHTRITATEALRHPFFTSADYFAPDQTAIHQFDWSLYIQARSTEEWEALTLHEIGAYTREEFVVNAPLPSPWPMPYNSDNF